MVTPPSSVIITEIRILINATKLLFTSSSSSRRWPYTTPTLPQALPLHGNKREREKWGKITKSNKNNEKPYEVTCCISISFIREKEMAYLLKTVGKKTFVNRNKKTVCCQSKRLKDMLLFPPVFPPFTTFIIEIVL